MFTCILCPLFCIDWLKNGYEFIPTQQVVRKILSNEEWNLIYGCWFALIQQKVDNRNEGLKYDQ